MTSRPTTPASKQLPYRVVVEAPTLFALAGDVRGKTILDLPCGDGTYAVRLCQARGCLRIGRGSLQRHG